MKDNERLDREALLRMTKEDLVERVAAERQRVTKALKALADRKLEVHVLKIEIRELESWKQRAEKLLSEVRDSADKLLSRNFKRLLRGPKTRRKKPSDEVSPIPDAVPHRADVRLPNFLPDDKPAGGILTNPGPFR